MNRYKKDHHIDGWPVVDTEQGRILYTNDIVKRLNDYEALLVKVKDKNQEEYRLFDGQWMNIVNNECCYKRYSVEEAVNIAVKKTEEAMAKNIRDWVWPKPRQGVQP